VRSGSTGAWVYTFYKNGVHVGSFSSTINPGSSGVSPAIGRPGDWAAARMPHAIKDIRCYNATKTAAQIKSIYELDTDNTNALFVYGTSETSGTTGVDSSGAANNAVLTNITAETFFNLL
jgi:hypothetical protein